MATVELTQGQFAVVDDADLPLVDGYSWCATSKTKRGKACWYATTGVQVGGGRQTTCFMHRLILGLQPGDPQVDHRDGDGLNNQRNNLRLATNSQNQANSNGSPSRRKSRYKGVYWNRDSRYRAGGRWRAEIKVNGRKMARIARTEIDAARIYNELAIRHFGEFARLNDTQGG